MLIWPRDANDNENQVDIFLFQEQFCKVRIQFETSDFSRVSRHTIETFDSDTKELNEFAKIFYSLPSAAAVHLIDSRYLIFVSFKSDRIDPDHKPGLLSGTYFDIKELKWYKINQILMTINKHKNQSEDFWISMIEKKPLQFASGINGCNNDKGMFLVLNNMNEFFKVKIDASISWKQERLVWIAHHKNRNSTAKCALSIIPKDVMFHILSFLRNHNAICNEYSSKIFA